MAERSDSFYTSDSTYYDKDANMNFEARADVNPLLQRIREDFREITVKYPFGYALEIGCGPGFDVAWCIYHDTKHASNLKVNVLR